jgi:class 3 adenylate cyclase
MFVLPEFEPEGGVPLMLAAPDLVRRLWVIRDQLASSHPFRVSLSVGMVYVGQVEGEGYSEWSIFGEAVNLAKRAAVLLSTADAVELGAGGALGVLVREEKSQEYFDVLLRHFTLKGSWPQAKVVADPPPLKGISQYRCVLLV